MVVLVVAEITTRDKRSDTLSVFHVRPLSNLKYIIGRARGIARVFIELNLIALLLALGINLWGSPSPLAPWLYLFYLITYSLPSLLFMIGLSLLVARWIKHQSLILFVLLTYVGISYSYLPEIYRGTFDFLGIGIPNLFSSVTGHPNLPVYLLQRSAFLLMGLGCLGVAVWLFHRLSDRNELDRAKTGAFVLLLFGVVCCLGYFYIFQKDCIASKRYTNTFLKYAGSQDLSMKQQDITYKQQGNRIEVQAKLWIKNKTKQELPKMILYLNPALKVQEITSKGEKISFLRENQVIIINQAIKPDKETILQVKYEGYIDERICYLDIPDKVREETRWLDPLWRYGKRYAFLKSDYTLLTPECLWYPVVIPPVNLESNYATGKDFSTYMLQVIHPKDRTVISQGECLEREDTTYFRPTERLTGISLCIGSYKKEVVKMKSFSIEAYYIDNAHWKMFPFKEMQNTFPVICETTLKDYPFRELRVVEIPATFTSYARNWKGGSDWIQPALVFIPERAITLPDINFFRKDENLSIIGAEEADEIENQIAETESLFNDLFWSDQISISNASFWTSIPFMNTEERRGNAVEMSYAPNLYCIKPMYSDHVNYIYSENYPGIDPILARIPQWKINDIRWQMATGNYNGTDKIQQARSYLANHSLREASVNKKLDMEVTSAIFDQMSLFLKNKIATKVSCPEFDRFFQEFRQAHMFQEVSLEQFSQAFYDRFDWDLMPWLPYWYNENKRPRLIIKDIQTDALQHEELKGYTSHFRIYNPTEEDAIISVSARSRPVYANNFEIGAGKAKEIRFITQTRPVQILINTGLSENIPTTINWTAKPGKTIVSSDTSQGIFDMDPDYFQLAAGEIIVDNEDPGFTIDEVAKYQNITTNSSPQQKKYGKFLEVNSNKWTPIIEDNCYGSHILSAYARLREREGDSVSWTTSVPKAGRYELWVYIPWITSVLHEKGTILQQYYTIEENGAEREIEIDILKDTGWVLLGEFELLEGENKVTLLDKGVKGQRLIADAVKWKRIKK